MLLWDGASMFLAVMSAARKLDSKVLKKIRGVKNLRFANEEEVARVTKCLPGAVPPFGRVFSIETIMDESLRLQGDTINFNCGLRTRSICMSVSDYISVENPQISSFTKA